MSYIQYIKENRFRLSFDREKREELEKRKAGEDRKRRRDMQNLAIDDPQRFKLQFGKTLDPEIEELHREGQSVLSLMYADTKIKRSPVLPLELGGFTYMR